MGIPRFTPVPDLTEPVAVRGDCEMIADAEHFDRVVRNGIGKAAVSIDIATADFKAMLVPDGSASRNAPSIVRVLADLAKRGVEVRLLHAGVPSGPALEQLKKVRHDRLTIRRCPRLHTKLVLTDAATLYLGSANLTGAGLGAKGPTRRNFEMGVVTEAAAMIDAASEYFNRIWEGEHCDGCGRRAVCPEPLEEPRL